MLFIAILILIFLMYRFFTFRAEMVFTMSLIAPIMIVIGACYLPGKYHEAGIFLLVIGAFMLAVVLLICRLTARTAAGVLQKPDYLWRPQIFTEPF